MGLTELLAPIQQEIRNLQEDFQKNDKKARDTEIDRPMQIIASQAQDNLRGNFSPNKRVLMICDASDGDYSITLPRADETLNNTFIFKKSDTTENVITITGQDSSELIDENETVTLNSSGDSLEISSDNGRWRVISGKGNIGDFLADGSVPMTGNLDTGGNDIILDIDGDSKIVSPSDDIVEFQLAGTSRYIKFDGTFNTALQINADGSQDPAIDFFQTDALKQNIFYDKSSNIFILAGQALTTRILATIFEHGNTIFTASTFRRTPSVSTTGKWTIKGQDAGGSNNNGGDLDVTPGAKTGSGTPGILNLGISDADEVNIGMAGNKIGFHGVTAVVLEAVTGSRGGNAALADLLTKLANKGIITDSTS